ncbi:MAG: T9SS type A sorting domain-containing protein [Bacteriovoracaceae bacterium]|jgi:hypothetical protein|nr:T9SS type A sorting domain-containing protein [Bacteriovoracaceae bacterium]
MKINLFITILFFSFCANAKTYQIKKGKHSASGLHTSSFSGDTLKFSAKFDQTAVYPQDYTDGGWNKLYGFSDCSSQHHKNSIRIGWRWYNNELQIAGYGYENANRFSRHIESVPLNESVLYQIKALEDEYEVTIGQNSYYFKRGCSDKKSIKYKLFPYFGGSKTAYQDISIDLDEIDPSKTLVEITRAYPNPSSGPLNIEIKNNEYFDQLFKLEIIDTSGRLVKQIPQDGEYFEVYARDTKKLELNLYENNELATQGMYLIRVITNEKKVSKSIQKIIFL